MSKKFSDEDIEHHIKYMISHGQRVGYTAARGMLEQLRAENADLREKYKTLERKWNQSSYCKLEQELAEAKLESIKYHNAWDRGLKGITFLGQIIDSFEKGFIKMPREIERNIRVCILNLKKWSDIEFSMMDPYPKPKEQPAQVEKV